MDNTKEIQKEIKSLGRKPNWGLYSKLIENL